MKLYTPIQQKTSQCQKYYVLSSRVFAKSVITVPVKFFIQQAKISRIDRNKINGPKLLFIKGGAL